MSVRNVTEEEVQEAVLNSGISYISSHDCGICQEYVGYRIIEGDLYWDGSCGCCSSGPQPRDWDALSRWVNMQDRDENKIAIAAKVGIELHDDNADQAHNES